jgi:formylglycine-generating enzyme required for sulfatase activity
MDLNAALSGMVAIPGGTFTMGSTVFYPEEALCAG